MQARLESRCLDPVSTGEIVLNSIGHLKQGRQRHSKSASRKALSAVSALSSLFGPRRDPGRPPSHVAGSDSPAAPAQGKAPPHRPDPGPAALRMRFLGPSGPAELQGEALRFGPELPQNASGSKTRRVKRGPGSQQLQTLWPARRARRV